MSRTRTLSWTLPLLALGLVLSGLPGGGPAGSDEGGTDTEGLAVLVFSRTAGFRHGSIPAGIAAIQQLGASNGFAVEATEDPAAFSAANLARFDAVVWLSTTGDVLDEAQQAAFENYIRNGGGYAGIHSAADTEKTGWPFYAQLVGALFQSHPAIAEASINVDDPAHPATAHLPRRWDRTDEWYNYQANPRGAVHVLMTLDETTYTNNADAMGYDHPISWCHDTLGGRAFYTGLGHTDESYAEPAFLTHMLNGILWAAGAVEADCGATLDANFVKTPVVEDTAKPIRLEAAPDGRIFFLEQGGQVKYYDPTTNAVVTVADFAARGNLFTDFENGTIGITFDPDFLDNGWVYVYYTPGTQVPCPASEAANATCGEVWLSRFTLTGDSWDWASEKVLLKVQQQRNTCCHTTGDLAFDAAGNLYLSTGDDTNPWESGGYTPIDERADRNAWDAQRTSANTNDLRGKIIRIHPEDDGTYTIPAGNLFPPGMENTRPEIYSMGHRNPFTIVVDPVSQALVVAEYGPDASTANPTRGPEGQVELNYITQAGNYGWPYCIGYNTPFLDYQFLAGFGQFVQVGVPGIPVVGEFDCDAPVNNSPNNTGLTDLPPVQPAALMQTYGSGEEHRIVHGQSPMTGPFFDATRSTPGVGLPAYYHGAEFWMDWNEGKLYELRRDESRTIRTINPFVPSMSFIRPQEMVQGLDGSLYVAEWGDDTNFFGPNTNSGIYRITYRG